MGKPEAKIRSRTVLMKAPLKTAGRVIRTPVDRDAEALAAQESVLRRQAYRNTTIRTGESFFDDSDMSSPYYLVIIYDELSGMPLLSCRYFFSLDRIGDALAGDAGTELKPLEYPGFNLEEYAENTIFLADRLSGNIMQRLYRHYRPEIFEVFYREILRKGRGRTLLLMVRKEKRDSQLKKYFQLGFSMIGSVTHKGREHSVIKRVL